MWHIPPIIGQKVMLNPSSSSYEDFNRSQAKGSDGYIISLTAMSLGKWFINEIRLAVSVLWENGNVNSYYMDALLPIDSFKTVERVEFKSGVFSQVYDERTRNVITNRVIIDGDDVKHYSMFDKEKRLEVLQKAEATYHTLSEERKQKEDVQTKYMYILEEIERTKRAEESVLFLDTEEEVTQSSPKKHQEDQVHSTLTNSFNQACDLGAGAIGMSSYMQQMEILGANARRVSEVSPELADLYQQIRNEALDIDED